MKRRAILTVLALVFLLSGCAQAEMVYVVSPGGEIVFRSRVAFADGGPETVSIVSSLAQHWEEQGYRVYKGVDPGEVGAEKRRVAEASDTECKPLAELLSEHSFVVEEIGFSRQRFGVNYDLRLMLDFSGIVSEEDLAALPPREAEAALAGLEEIELVVAFELPGRLVETNADRVLLTESGVRLEWDFAYGDRRELAMSTYLRHPLPWWMLAAIGGVIVLLVLAGVFVAMKLTRWQKNNGENTHFAQEADE